MKGRSIPIGKAALLAALTFFIFGIAEPIGGWLADYLIKLGWNETRTRKGIVTVGWVTGLLLIPAGFAESNTTALICMFGAALVGLSTGNLLAILQCCAPPDKVGIWTGVKNYSGNLGGITAPLLMGFLLKRTGSYNKSPGKATQLTACETFQCQIQEHHWKAGTLATHKIDQAVPHLPRHEAISSLRIRNGVIDVFRLPLPSSILAGYPNYNPAHWTVQNLILVPSFAFSLSCLEKRKALRSTAERAGWVGCNILLVNIPADARIPVVVNGKPNNPALVRRQYDRLRPLENLKSDARGWTLDVLNVVRSLGKREFTLAEVYGCEDALGRLHPDNRHVRDKIRQQLQFLRDVGFVEFLGRGIYRLS